MRPVGAIAALLLLTANACPDEAQGDQNPIDSSSQSQSRFIGTYHTALDGAEVRMQIREDGTFAWKAWADDWPGMRAKGDWRENGDTVTFTSNPAPIPPTVEWVKAESKPDGPMLRVFDQNGDPIAGSAVMTKCADGQSFFGPVGPQGSSPNPEQCPQPVSVRIMILEDEFDSEIFDLAQNGWRPGMTIRFEYRPGDAKVGEVEVIDVSGMTATLDNGKLALSDPLEGDILTKVE